MPKEQVSFGTEYQYGVKWLLSTFGTRPHSQGNYDPRSSLIRLTNTFEGPEQNTVGYDTILWRPRRRKLNSWILPLDCCLDFQRPATRSGQPLGKAFTCGTSFHPNQAITCTTSQICASVCISRQNPVSTFNQLRRSTCTVRQLQFLIGQGSFLS